ncbi:MAG: oxygen-independent coproporphyrinogen III oxidase [Thermosynechococcaceae cyanobacterium]
MQLLPQAVNCDSKLLRKYDRPLPRYTSYPPATELREGEWVGDFRSAIAAGNTAKTPLSLYCHIPFCQSACYFCGCNTIVTQSQAAPLVYLEYLTRQIEQVASWVDHDRTVNQMHWGGGTPNYLTLGQVASLWETLHRSFRFEPDAELSIEINPRYVDRDYILGLRSLGFNRISFGIQDFNPQVQAAVNLIQPEAMLFDVMAWIKEAAFESVNVDLIYGLPFQRRETFIDTVKKTIQLNPDRIAVFNFAYMPEFIPVQKHIHPENLPLTSEKLDILQRTIAQLTEHDYLFIGMDHFAKPGDELAIAQRQGQLHRNFQGYTTQPDSDLLGFGISAISMLQNLYVQNHKQLQSYYRAIDDDALPLSKGVCLNQDDLIRRALIIELMCQFRLNKREIEQKYSLNFDDYFKLEQSALKALEADGLLRYFDDEIRVTPTGRLLIRNIAAVFDGYLKDQEPASFSRAI